MEKLKKQLKQVRPFDIVIIVGLMLASFLPHAVFAYQQVQTEGEGSLVAVVTIDGKEVHEVELNSDTPHELLTFHPSKNQYNIIEIDGERIRVKEDNSPDQIAVRKGWISKPGESAICLPHKLMIEIKTIDGEKDRGQDEMIIPL